MKKNELHIQKITVTNKGQLLAAVGCAMDSTEITEITLLRKTGKTFYTFYDNFGDRYNKEIQRVRGRIRGTPASCFTE